MKTWRYLIPLICVVLAGCEATTFESAPASVGSQCDAKWQGGWIGRDDDGNDDPTFAVFINDQCEIEDVNAKRTATIDRIIKPTFFRASGHDYVAFSAMDMRQLASESSDNQHIPSSGFFILRWQRDSDQLILRMPASKRVATLIIDGAIDGSVDRQQNGTLRNVVSGNAEHIQHVLSDIDLYGEGNARLHWSGITRKSLESALAKLRRAKSSNDGKH